MNPVHTFNPVFFDSGRVVHLMNPRTGYTFCGLAGGRPLWMATVTLDVPNGCRRCVANAAKDLRGGVYRYVETPEQAAIAAESVTDAARAAVQQRYAPGFPGFTQQMLDEAAKADEEF